MGGQPGKRPACTPRWKKDEAGGRRTPLTIGDLLRTLIAIPVFNEQKYVRRVLTRVREFAQDILVIDDGSTDQTPQIVDKFDVRKIRREGNAGYGQSMQDAFAYAQQHEFDWLITMDCDEQHEPASIPAFLERAEQDDLDVISGSRYLCQQPTADSPPAERRAINGQITQELNERLGLKLTDAFCGFKAYRVESLASLRLSEHGYAFPMPFWVQAVAAGLRIGEVPVRLIYNDLTRSFGGHLDDAGDRLRHYRQVLHCELERCASRLPESALEGVDAGCRCGS